LKLCDGDADICRRSRAAYSIEKARASGRVRKKSKKKIQEAQHFKAIYKNPAVSVAMTLIEVFPVGLGRTLLSAAILRSFVVVNCWISRGTTL